MAVLAASDRGGLFNAPDFYMKKLAAPPSARGKVDIRKSATENIKILSECLGLAAEELTIESSPSAELRIIIFFDELKKNFIFFIISL